MVRIVVARTSTTSARNFSAGKLPRRSQALIIGINAFNQPDVEASKIETRKLTSEYETTGKLPPESPFFDGDGVKLYADEKNAAALKGGADARGIFEELISAASAPEIILRVLAYITMNDAHEEALAGHSPRRARQQKSRHCAWDLGRAFFIPRDRHTKADPTPAFSCRLPATTPSTFSFPGRNTPLAL